MSAKIVRRAWRVSEERALRERYPKEGSAALAEEMGRSQHAVNSMAKRLGIKSNHRAAPRTLDEIRAKCEVEEVFPHGTGCWIWQGGTCGRSHTPRIHTTGNKTVIVRRFVWELEHGEPPPEGRYVAVRCGCSMCVNPEHLQIITPQQHIRRATNGGKKAWALGAAVRRQLTRIRSGHCRLDWEKAAEIRSAEGTCKEVAARYGVSASTVSSIRRGKLWREPSGIGALM